MDYVIEKGIPVPEKAMGGPRKYPLYDMDIGDSFSAPLENVKSTAGYDQAQGKIASAATYCAKKTGRKFKVLVFKDEGIIRCWRTE